MNNSLAPSVRSILNSSESFLIPIYQRSYVWTKYNWKTLWQDLVAVAEGERIRHFIGSIILSEEEQIENGVEQVSQRKEWLVIDGQQRLTTLTLLIAATCHWLADQEGEDIRFAFKKFKEDYLFKKTDEHGETKQTLRLKPSSANEVFFNKLLDPLKESKRIKTKVEDKESQIYAAFNYFYSQIATYKKDGNRRQAAPEDVVDLIEKGLDGMQMVRIELDKEDDPQRIFDSINHLGFILSESDLIRNYILQGLPDKNKRREFHDNFWSPIEKAAKEPSDKKNDEDNDKVPDFFRHYLTMKLGKPVKERGEEGVYETFRSVPSLQFKEKGKTNIDKCKSVLGEILRFSGYYEKFLNPKTEKNAEIRRQLEYVRQLPQASVMLPFLLQVLEDYNRNTIGMTTLVMVLELVQSYTVRCIFAGRRRQGHNRLWAGLYQQSFKGKLDKYKNVKKSITDKEYIECIRRGLGNRAPNEMFPDNDEVEGGIKEFPVYKSNRNFTKYLLQRLEEQLRGRKKHDTIPDYPSLTIEHIYPQQAEKGTNWVGNTPFKVTEEEHKIIKRSFLHVLGNLTLTICNSEMGNKPYAYKVRKGFEPSGLRLNDLLNNSIRKWDKKRIVERTEYLSKLFFKIWQDIPQKYKESTEIEATLILDVESLTEGGKLRPIKSALFGKAVEIEFPAKSKGVWFLREELVPEDTPEGRFYNEIMKTIAEEYKGTLDAIGLRAEEREEIDWDENDDEIIVNVPYFIVPWEPDEGTGSQIGKFKVRIKYDEMLENIQQAAKQTDVAGKLRIQFAE